MDKDEALKHVDRIRGHINQAAKSYARVVGVNYPAYPADCHPDDVVKIDQRASMFARDLEALSTMAWNLRNKEESSDGQTLR